MGTDIDGDGPLVAALAQPDERVATGCLGAEAAQGVARAGSLDLDDVGTELTEDRGTERTGEVRPQVEDPDAVEGLH